MKDYSYTEITVRFTLKLLMVSPRFAQIEYTQIPADFCR